MSDCQEGTSGLLEGHLSIQRRARLEPGRLMCATCLVENYVATQDDCAVGHLAATRHKTLATTMP